MIIVRIIGGLGNQLFQYALGRKLSVIKNTKLKLDITEFPNYYPLRDYSLHYLNIIENIATKKEILFFKNRHKEEYIRETTFCFEPNIFNVPSSCYLEGYWQSERYFKDIRNILDKEFSIKKKTDDQNERFAEKILRCNSISVHIRRRDYIYDIENSRVYNIYSLSYYEKSFSYIAERIENPIFFIFSDDKDWAKINTKINFPVYFADFNNGDNDYEDLKLISLCKHHITTNSTFGWWGAWLSPNKNKIVITPKQWFNDMRDDKDLIPEEWIRL